MMGNGEHRLALTQVGKASQKGKPERGEAVGRFMGQTAELQGWHKIILILQHFHRKLP